MSSAHSVHKHIHNHRLREAGGEEAKVSDLVSCDDNRICDLVRSAPLRSWDGHLIRP